MALFDPNGAKSEADIQSEALRRARGDGWLADKYENKSRRGGPDTLFSRKGSHGRLQAIWIEFKRLGEEPGAQQVKRHGELRKSGFIVAWFDTVEGAMAFLTSHKNRPE